jgi:hypothetical protein
MPNTGLSAGQIRQMFMDFFIQKVQQLPFLFF